MSRLSRSSALVAVSALLLTLVPGAAQAAPDDRAGTWLTRQLTGGLVHNDQYSFDDYGLTADVAFALIATGGQASHVADIRTALATHVDSWTTGVDFGTDDVYAGSVAKAVVLAEATGADPRSFGGVDLVQRLNRRISADIPTVGRIQDKSATDYANTIGQAFAARGLAVAGSGKADEAIRFLLEQQCSGGWFRLNFAGKAKADQSCDAGKRSTTSAPDTDVTALAVINLRPVPHKSAAVKAAIKDAVAWLKHHQKDNGSFGGGPATETSNANSTGLAAWALGGSGACGAASKAAAWVKKLQVGDVASGKPLDGERGAIAYDRTAYDAAATDGITTETQDQWRRATSQAAPGLGYLTCG
ncbi:hypothetical protein [Nocardioides sp. LS1]|uniref:hypothetical protein n=1 Tax=Nocardioides sp. LS1 TaxID=1027620 RepID=UPI000F623D4E|nr:hypothetical protein [Nocardioides sp. LS1]GCD92316.1 hypothetical protein NLS1_43220 [Nocardioides sp. LS1]